MRSVKALAIGVAQREQSRTRQITPNESGYGSHEAFEALTRVQIEEAKLCAVDMEDVLNALRLWHTDGAWSSWMHPTRRQWGALDKVAIQIRCIFDSPNLQAGPLEGILELPPPYVLP